MVLGSSECVMEVVCQVAGGIRGQGQSGDNDG
jgi:hypothetical protein